MSVSDSTVKADVLFGEGDAAKYLGGENSPVSVRTLQRWRMEGTGPVYVRLGRLVRYRQRDLDAWLASCLRRSTSER